VERIVINWLLASPCFLFEPLPDHRIGKGVPKLLFPNLSDLGIG
jgi:hypothetical protein